jgi:hypothetical protein
LEAGQENSLITSATKSCGFEDCVVKLATRYIMNYLIFSFHTRDTAARVLNQLLWMTRTHQCLLMNPLFLDGEPGLKDRSITLSAA